MRIEDPSTGPYKALGHVGYIPPSFPNSEWFDGYNMGPPGLWCLRDTLTNPRAGLFHVVEEETCRDILALPLVHHVTRNESHNELSI